jgi:hypothetical protein
VLEPRPPLLVGNGDVRLHRAGGVQVERPRHGIVDELVDEAKLERLLGTDDPPGEQQLERAGGSDQPDRPAPPR